MWKGKLFIDPIITLNAEMEQPPMKILSTLIEVLTHFENDGTPHPLRLKLNGETIKIDQGPIRNRREARKQ